MSNRPPFIVSCGDVPETTHRYPNSTEGMGPSRAIGRTAGLRRIGLHIQRLPPGSRSSWPHAESLEEEFVYVLDGDVVAWIDGAIHPLRAGDLVAFPSGTGICHAILNNGDRDATLLVGGEADKPDNRIYYPLHAQRRLDLPSGRWWHDVPVGPQGSHDGMPDALRSSEPSST
jgi:uncharacterized cupin superfamily protein